MNHKFGDRTKSNILGSYLGIYVQRSDGGNGNQTEAFIKILVG